MASSGTGADRCSDPGPCGARGHPPHALVERAGRVGAARAEVLHHQRHVVVAPEGALVGVEQQVHALAGVQAADEEEPQAGGAVAQVHRRPRRGGSGPGRRPGAAPPGDRVDARVDHPVAHVGRGHPDLVGARVDQLHPARRQGPELPVEDLDQPAAGRTGEARRLHLAHDQLGPAGQHPLGGGDDPGHPGGRGVQAEDVGVDQREVHATAAQQRAGDLAVDPGERGDARQAALDDQARRAVAGGRRRALGARVERGQALQGDPRDGAVVVALRPQRRPRRRGGAPRSGRACTSRRASARASGRGSAQRWPAKTGTSAAAAAETGARS